MKKKIFALAAIAVVIILIAVLYKLPAKTYTTDDVLSNPGKFENQSIEVSGSVQTVNCISTLMECPESDPCCNSVSCSLALKGDSGMIFLASNASIFGCSGTNCEVQCSIEPGNYTIGGMFSSFYGEHFLDVEQISE